MFLMPVTHSTSGSSQQKPIQRIKDRKTKNQNIPKKEFVQPKFGEEGYIAFVITQIKDFFLFNNLKKAIEDNDKVRAKNCFLRLIKKKAE